MLKGAHGSHLSNDIMPSNFSDYRSAFADEADYRAYQQYGLAFGAAAGSGEMLESVNHDSLIHQPKAPVPSK